MICKKCGSEILNGGQFCQSCGSRADGAGAPPPVQPYAAAAPASGSGIGMGMRLLLSGLYASIYYVFISLFFLGIDELCVFLTLVSAALWAVNFFYTLGKNTRPGGAWVLVPIGSAVNILVNISTLLYLAVFLVYIGLEALNLLGIIAIFSYIIGAGISAIPLFFIKKLQYLRQPAPVRQYQQANSAPQYRQPDIAAQQYRQINSDTQQYQQTYSSALPAYTPEPVKPAKSEAPVDENIWVCPGCGLKNPNDVQFCGRCGQEH